MQKTKKKNQNKQKQKKIKNIIWQRWINEDSRIKRLKRMAEIGKNNVMDNVHWY